MAIVKTVTVEIRSPFPEYALPRVWGWMQEFKNRVADDFGPQTVDAWVDQEFSGKTCRTWGVYRDGELGGMIVFQRLSPWLGTAHCTFRKDFWGRATTRPAIEQALRQMFNSGIGKLTFLVFADNQAIRAVMDDFGAPTEGTMKGHTLRNGVPVNMVSIGLLKEKFDAAVSNRASHADLGTDRGRGLDSGERSVGKAKDADPDKHQHANVLPGNAGASEASA